MPCRLCNDMRPHNPGSFFLQTDFSELCDAAKLGCPFCSVIRSGILQLVIGGDIVNIQIKSVRETGRAYTFLYVMLEFRAGRSTNLEFYASDS
jgi:hypothetical protein